MERAWYKAGVFYGTMGRDGKGGWVRFERNAIHTEAAGEEDLSGTGQTISRLRLL